MELDKVEVLVEDENGVGTKFTWAHDNLIQTCIVFNIDTWDERELTMAVQSSFDQFEKYLKENKDED